MNEVVINNGAEVTLSRIVTLGLTAEPDVTHFKVSTDDELSYSPEYPLVSEVEWILPEDNGTKTVYVIFSFNSTEYDPVSAEIYLNQLDSQHILPIKVKVDFVND